MKKSAENLGIKGIVLNNISLEAKEENFKRVKNHSLKISNNIIKNKNRIMDYLLCIDEIFINAVLHGYKDEKGKVDIIYILNSEYFITLIKDYGLGMPKNFSVDDIKLNNNPLDESGRGLFIVKSLADRLIINTEGKVGTEVSIYFERREILDGGDDNKR